VRPWALPILVMAGCAAAPMENPVAPVYGTNAGERTEPPSLAEPPPEALEGLEGSAAPPPPRVRVGSGEGTGAGSGFGSGRGGFGGISATHNQGVARSAEMPAAAGEDPPVTLDGGPMAAVKRALDGLGLANLAFSPPAKMRVQEQRMVELLMSPTKSVEALRGDLVTAEGSEVASGVQVSPRMEAALTGAGFSVQALGPEQQVVNPAGTTRWAWNVTPTTPGKQTLHLVLSARVEVQGSDAPFVVRTFDRYIEVEITLMQRAEALLTAHWQWLWALLVPPALEWWRRWRKRSKEKKSSPSSGDGAA
jgi:hypothetical protein